jgi:hypothetical protein
VNLVIQNVSPVTNIQVVLLVLKEELNSTMLTKVNKNVLVMTELGLMPIGFVNLVLINVHFAPALLTIVTHVTVLESMLQLVLAHLDISMIVSLIVKLVLQDVVLVLPVTLVLLVLLEDQVPLNVHAHLELLNLAL